MKNKYLFFMFVISGFFIHGSKDLMYKDIQGLKLKNEEDVLCPSPNENFLEISNSNNFLPIRYFSSEFQELDLTNGHFIPFKDHIDRTIQETIAFADDVEYVDVFLDENRQQAQLKYFFNDGKESDEIVDLNFDE